MIKFSVSFWVEYPHDRFLHDVTVMALSQEQALQVAQDHHPNGYGFMIDRTRMKHGRV